MPAREPVWRMAVTAARLPPSLSWTQKAKVEVPRSKDRRAKPVRVLYESSQPPSQPS